MLRKCAWLLLVLLCAWPALAESKARIVRLSFVEGDVELDRGDGRGFVRAFQNMPVIEGVRLWTRADARVEVEFEDGGTLRLVPDSMVGFEELRLGNSGEKITRVDVQQGTVYANLKDHDHDQLAFTFAQQQLTLRHSSRFRLDIDKEQLKVAVFRGELELQRPNAERVKIKKNETLAIDFSEPERYYLAKGISEETHDYWDRDREEQRVAAENRYRQESPGGSSYSSYNDLAWYGSWTTVPTYGYVWRPYGVGFGWDPFAYGAWVWYPRFGYIWTSAYPWGWTPYRYGSWVFINNRGWCWRGGPRIVNITNINIVNPPPRYIAPRPPVVNNTPIVTVAAGNTRPADPRGDWMPRVGPRDGGPRVVTENEPRPGVPGRRAFTNDDVAPARDNAGDSAAANTRSGIAPRDIQRNPGVSTKAGINESPRTRTLDKDYDAVDYRRSATPNRQALPATTPATDAAEASRMQRGRPDPDRDDISRPSVNRGPAEERLTTPNVEGPRRNSAPAIDRSDPRPEPRAERATPEPRVERPAPQPRVETPQPRVETPQPRVDRPAPTPSAPRGSPRASMPERSSSPPPAAPVQRSSPPPSAPVQRSSPPPSAPAASAPRPSPAPAAAPRAGSVRDR